MGTPKSVVDENIPLTLRTGQTLIKRHAILTPHRQYLSTCEHLNIGVSKAVKLKQKTSSVAKQRQSLSGGRGYGNSFSAKKLLEDTYLCSAQKSQLKLNEFDRKRRASIAQERLSERPASSAAFTTRKRAPSSNSIVKAQSAGQGKKKERIVGVRNSVSNYSRKHIWKFINSKKEQTSV